MKICRVSYGLPPTLGGLQQHVAELSIRQARDGHQIHLVFVEGEAPRAEGITGHRIQAPAAIATKKTTRKRWYFFRSAWKTLKRLAREEKFHVLDAHGDFVEAFFIGRLGRQTKTPSVLTVHGGLSERLAARWASRFCFRFPTHFIAVSEWIAAQLRARGVPPSKISVISGGVDFSRFTATDENATDADMQPIVLFAGRLHAVKGCDVLLASARFVMGKIPSARLVIVGDGPEGQSLKQRASTLPNVLFTGQLASEAVAAWMKKASLLVQPSIPMAGLSEGQSRTVMEAMAAGLPIVASRTGGIVELFEEGRGGYFVPPGDPKALAEAILKVLSDRDAARAMGRYNQEAIQARDFQKTVVAVTKLFERLKQV